MATTKIDLCAAIFRFFFCSFSPSLTFIVGHHCFVQSIYFALFALTIAHFLFFHASRSLFLVTLLSRGIRQCTRCSTFYPEFAMWTMQDIRANFTSPVARFAVSNLHPGGLYVVSIYAFNSKGRSDPAVLPAAMLRPAEKQLTSEKGKYSNKINSKVLSTRYFLWKFTATHINTHHHTHTHLSRHLDRIGVWPKAHCSGE